MPKPPSGVYILKVLRVGRRQNKSVLAVAADNSTVPLYGLQGEVFCSSRVPFPEDTRIIVPSAVRAPWAMDRQRLWTLAEEAEKRADANLATLWEGHMPPMLSAENARQLSFAFGERLADYLNSAVDLAIQRSANEHQPAKLFALCSAREVHFSGFGDKNRFGLSMKQRIKRGLPTSHQTELLEMREAWAEICAAFSPKEAAASL